MKIDFIGIGAEKAGTTWLADMLRQHEGIFIPEQKELHYFNRKFVEDPSVDNGNFDKDLAWYARFFTDAQADQVTGEISPSYLWDSAAAERIKATFPDTKIIAVLRDPVDRAFSQFTYYQQKGVIPEKLDFLKALITYPYLKERSLYGAQMTKYFELFDSSQILVVFNKDIKADNVGVLYKTEDFLGVDRFIPENINERSNVTGTPKYPWLNKFLYQVRVNARKLKLNWLLDVARSIGLSQALESFRNDSKQENSKLVKLTTQEREQALPLFKEDIEKLEKLLNLSLDEWKK